MAPAGAAMRTGGDPVTSLNVAVNRLGRKLVSCIPFMAL
jgi:hypothetical protein